MRTKILIKIAESFLKDNFKEADRIPLELRPKEMHPSRCCIYKDRAVLKYRCMAALGFAPNEETDEIKSLESYGQDAVARKAAPKSHLSVIDIACSACIKSQYVITNACRGCFAQPCRLNCPREAIVITNGRASINPEKCVNCGRCLGVCPYKSIIRIPIPCEEACPVDAVKKDEFGREQIDEAKCISCGKCLTSCPFGAVVERSQIVDVLKLLKNQKQKAVAIIAPAIVGQFPGSIGNVVGALKKLGFNDVVEVALGADITTQKEAAEFIEKMQNGKKFMTTSCCPAYYKAAEVHIPEIKPFVSHTKTPMYYTSEMVKKETPDAAVVFIGPCLAKRAEAERDQLTDYVLTFEELGALFMASNILVAECEPEELKQVSHSQGRQFAISGGVAGAVAGLVEGKCEFKPEKFDGLTKESLKALKKYALKGGDNNMLEVMCCEGGCVAGPGCLTLPSKSGKAVETYAKSGEDLKNK